MKYCKLKKSDFNSFKKKKYDKGVLTLNLASWIEFDNVVKIFNNCPDYIWRGQRLYRWKLKSSFDRLYPNISNRKKELDKLLKNFRQKLNDLPNSRNNNFNDDEIWAIGQHYGLPTPLLDWTGSPYIAAYMAFFKIKKSKRPYKRPPKRVIFAINRALKRCILKIKNNKTKKELSKDRLVEFDLDRNIFDKEHNQRLKNQKGKFTISLDGTDIKATVKKCWPHLKCTNDEIILAEIRMPNNVREDCLTYLEKEKKITHGTLFPDYAGTVEICKIQLGLFKNL